MASALQSPAEATDFAVTIGYDGPEDKPFYRACLLSRTRAGEYVAQPFWGSAVIGARELAALVDALAAGGVRFSPGRHPAGSIGYYVEIDDSGEWSHCPLGFGGETLTWLAALAGALDEANRGPLLDIIGRIGFLRGASDGDTERR